MSRIAPGILIAATLPALLAAAEPDGRGPPRSLRYPGKSWSLAVDLSGYQVVVEEVGRDPLRVRARGENFDTGVRVVIELVPLNDDWPTLAIDAANPGRVVATMVEHRHYRRP